MELVVGSVESRQIVSAWAILGVDTVRSAMAARKPVVVVVALEQVSGALGC